MIVHKSEYLEFLLSKGFKNDTLVRVDLYLEQFRTWLQAKSVDDIRQVTPTTIMEYQFYLTEYKKTNGQNLHPLTIVSKFSVIRGYFSYLLKRRDIFLNPTLDVDLPKTGRYLPKNILTQDEAKRLLGLPKDDPMGIRDKAILEVLYSTGIRSGELRKLDIYDFNLHDKLVHIKNPKNKKDRIIPTGEMAKKAIEEYLSKSRPRLARIKHADPKDNALFLSQYGKRMSKGSIPYILRTYSKKMNLGKRITPHCLRHSFATHLLQNGAELPIIQELLGHTRIKTTQIYLQIAQPDLKKTIRDYHPRGQL